MQINRHPDSATDPLNLVRYSWIKDAFFYKLVIICSKWTNLTQAEQQIIMISKWCQNDSKMIIKNYFSIISDSFKCHFDVIVICCSALE